MKFEFKGLTLDKTHEYEFGLTPTAATNVETWHLIAEYTESTASVDIVTTTKDLREVVNTVDTGYITIKDKTSDKVILEPYSVDLKIPFLRVTNYNVIQNGKDLDASNIQITLRCASNSKAYYQYEKIIDKDIINEYSIKNIDYTSFAGISAMNNPLSTTSEYYLPFLMLLESWRAMTTPPNWEYSDFIKALEKRNIDLSNTEKETLKFVFGEIQTPPDNVEKTIQSFNKRSEKEQISMREEKLRELRKQTYKTYFGPSTDFTCQLINARSIIRLIHSLDRKLTETEIKEFTAPITDRRLLKVIDQTNFSYKPQSLQGH